MRIIRKMSNTSILLSQYLTNHASHWLGMNKKGHIKSSVVLPPSKKRNKQRNKQECTEKSYGRPMQDSLLIGTQTCSIAGILIKKLPTSAIFHDLFRYFTHLCHTRAGRVRELPRSSRPKFKLVWHQFSNVQFARHRFVWKVRSVQFGAPGPRPSLQFVQFS